MASTKYNVFAADEVREVKSKRQVAIDLATAIRKDERVAVRVETENGKVVFEAAAPKRIKMSPPYTRVVSLPEDVEVPDGFRVAYHRPRRKVAVLHDVHEGYRLLNTETSELSEEVFETTRDCGAAMKTL